jgi:hypothetical protein
MVGDELSFDKQLSVSVRRFNKLFLPIDEGPLADIFDDEVRLAPFISAVALVGETACGNGWEGQSREC